MSLCMWTRAMDVYARVARSIEPKKEKLKEAEAGFPSMFRATKIRSSMWQMPINFVGSSFWHVFISCDFRGSMLHLVALQHRFFLHLFAGSQKVKCQALRMQMRLQKPNLKQRRKNWKQCRTMSLHSVLDFCHLLGTAAIIPSGFVWLTKHLIFNINEGPWYTTIYSIDEEYEWITYNTYTMIWNDMKWYELQYSPAVLPGGKLLRWPVSKCSSQEPGLLNGWIWARVCRTQRNVRRNCRSQQEQSWKIGTRCRDLQGSEIWWDLWFVAMENRGWNGFKWNDLV